MPDNPTSWNDLQALYTGDKGVSYSWEKNGVVLKNENKTMLFRNNLAKGDRITVTVRAGDETGSATVVIGNAPPQVTSISIEPNVFSPGVDIVAKPNASDPDGDTISYDYRWAINDMDIPDNSQVLKGEKFKKGDKITLVVTASDFMDKGNPYKVDVATVRNSPPFFVSTPPEKFSATQYTYHASAKDPDGDKVTYSLASAPGGMMIDPDSGMVTWPISSGDAGSHLIEIIAVDNEGAKCSQKYSLNISLNNGMNE